MRLSPSYHLSRKNFKKKICEQNKHNTIMALKWHYRKKWALIKKKRNKHMVSLLPLVICFRWLTLKERLFHIIFFSCRADNCVATQRNFILCNENIFLSFFYFICLYIENWFNDWNYCLCSIWQFVFVWFVYCFLAARCYRYNERKAWMSIDTNISMLNTNGISITYSKKDLTNFPDFDSTVFRFYFLY